MNSKVALHMWIFDFIFLSFILFLLVLWIEAPSSALFVCEEFWDDGGIYELGVAHHLIVIKA